MPRRPLRAVILRLSLLTFLCLLSLLSLLALATPACGPTGDPAIPTTLHPTSIRENDAASDTAAFDGSALDAPVTDAPITDAPIADAMMEAALCPNDLPTSCPPDAAGYAETVALLIQVYCLPCHYAGSPDANLDLSSYAIVHKYAGDIATQLAYCRMPLADAAQPALSEREQILGWLACNAPDN